MAWANTIRVVRDDGGSIQLGPYGHDGAGNLTTIQCATPPGQPIDRNRFRYDEVSRVAQQEFCSGQYQKYEYDAFGNLLKTRTLDPARFGFAEYRRDMPTSWSTNRLGAAAYDAAGNVSALGGVPFQWDALNLQEKRGSAIHYLCSV